MILLVFCAARGGTAAELNQVDLLFLACCFLYRQADFQYMPPGGAIKAGRSSITPGTCQEVIVTATAAVALILLYKARAPARISALPGFRNMFWPNTCSSSFFNQYILDLVNQVVCGHSELFFKIFQGTDFTETILTAHPD